MRKVFVLFVLFIVSLTSLSSNWTTKAESSSPGSLSAASAVLTTTSTPAPTFVPPGASGGAGTVTTAATTTTAGGIQMTLNDGWTLQSSAKVTATGATLSTATFQPTGWYGVTLPASVIAGLLQNNVYPDPYYGTNFQQINANDFSVPWWYRGTFTLPSSEAGKRVWIKFQGLNYRAAIWLNGTQISDGNTTVGPFRTFELDITPYVSYSSPNVIAVQVTRAVNPTANGGDLTITFVDWNPNPPDWNMGILNDVVVSTSGPAIVRNPLVTTTFDLPSLNVAHLTVVAEVRNGTPNVISGTLAGTIGTVTFSQAVTVAANSTQRVTFTPTAFPQLNISNPTIWWPWEYGAPALNTLTLTFSVGSQASDSLSTPFGIRQITSALNSTGTRVFSVNGKPILIRGGAWAPDIFQRRDPARQEAELKYVRDLNLNTIRFEGKMEDESMFNLADKYGVLVMIGWNCCDTWQSPGAWTTDQHTIAYESLRSLMYRFRSHPSMLMWLNGSDMPPSIGAYNPFKGDPATEQQYLNIESDLQWPNPILSSASDYQSTVQTEATGVKMLGPYEWEPPIYWETDTSHKAGGAWSFATEISPGPAVPPYDSLVKFIPAADLWPIDSVWNYHAGGSPFDNLNVFTSALNSRYGTATSVVDYAEKAQIAAYESHRAMFEAYGRDKYTASGVIQWMMRNAWPSMIWHLYDTYLRPGGAYYGAKNALEPLHIQYSYADKGIVVVNSTLQSYATLTASARVYNLDGTQKYNNSVNLGSVGPDSSTTLFNIPSISGLTTTYFLRLTLTDGSGKVLSTQTYWLSTKSDVLSWNRTKWYYTPTKTFANYTALATLPRVNVTSTDQVVTNGTSNDQTVTVTNTSSAIAFFVHLRITKGPSGEEVLPITWQDNYFTLLPGESRTIKATYNVADLGGASPVVSIDTWNNR